MTSTSEDPAGGRLTLVTLAGGNFAQLGARLLLGAVVPLLLTHFDTTKSSVGLALTGMWLVYALLQFPSGMLADRYGERTLLVAGLSGTVAGSILVALAPSLLLYGVFVLVLGAGTGLFFAPATALVSRLYEENGGPLGALTASGAVAGVIIPAAGGMVGVRFGWRIAIALGAVVAAPVLLGTLRFIPVLPPSNPNRSLRAALDYGRLRELLTRPSIAYTTGIGVVGGFAFQTFSSFFPTFLVEHRGLDTGVAGIVFGVVFGLSALAQPVAGRVSDRFSRDLAIGTSMTLAAIGFAVLLLVPSRIGLAAGTALLGLGISWPGPLQARFMDHLEEHERGFGFGLTRTVYMVIAASGSVIVGTLAETAGWIAGYGLAVGLLGGCLALLGVNRAFRLGL